MKYIELQNEVIAVLKAFGYNPEVKENTPSNGYNDIYFRVDNGFDSMQARHKDAILMLVKGHLLEFYYGGDIQHIYLSRECHGLEPNDNRYSCLLYKMKLVKSDEPYYKDGSEIFVNMGDRFIRFADWQRC